MVQISALRVRKVSPVIPGRTLGSDLCLWRTECGEQYQTRPEVNKGKPKVWFMFLLIEFED